MRGLQSTPPRQLALPVGGGDPLQRIWESWSPEAQERVLRLLAATIGRVVSAGEEQR